MTTNDRPDRVAGAVHDLRTALAVVLARVQMARRRLPWSDDRGQRVREDLDDAERQGRRAAALVDELEARTAARRARRRPEEQRGLG
jgi:signal transduction histidine kinase